MMQLVRRFSKAGADDVACDGTAYALFRLDMPLPEGWSDEEDYARDTYGRLEYHALELAGFFAHCSYTPGTRFSTVGARVSRWHILARQYSGWDI